MGEDEESMDKAVVSGLCFRLKALTLFTGDEGPSDSFTLGLALEEVKSAAADRERSRSVLILVELITRITISRREDGGHFHGE